MSNTIEVLWQDYKKHVLNECSAKEVERQHMTFYAAAMVSLEQVKKASLMSEDAGVAHVNNIQREFNEFNQNMIYAMITGADNE